LGPQRVDGAQPQLCEGGDVVGRRGERKREGGHGPDEPERVDVGEQAVEVDAAHLEGEQPRGRQQHCGVDERASRHRRCVVDRHTCKRPPTQVRCL
jgi:hypothetical protein